MTPQASGEQKTTSAGGDPGELWTEVHDTVQETGSKTISKKKKWKKIQLLSEEIL